jgi:N4-gp56 family major capsid protein
MAQTTVATSSTLTRKVLMSTIFATQAALMNPLDQAGMIGPNEGYVIQELNSELDQGGDQITYHRVSKFTDGGRDEGQPKEGYEQALTFHNDSVLVSSKDFLGRVSTEVDDQRTPYDLVEITMKQLQTQVAEWKAWLVVTYLAGKVGSNVEILSTTFTGWAGNTLTDVDSNHLMYGGNATAKADVDSSDTMVIGDLVRFKDKARSLTYKIPTLKVKAKDYNIILLHPNVWRDLRQANGTASWFDVEKAMLQGGQDPMANGLINAAVGIRDGCILVVCDQCPIYTDYGAGGNVRVSRVLFLGPQAAVWAKGRKTFKAEWRFFKKTFEYESEVGICARTIGGCKAVIFNSERNAMLAMDVATAAAA